MLVVVAAVVLASRKGRAMSTTPPPPPPSRPSPTSTTANVSDWTPADWPAYLAFCDAVGIADRSVPIRVWAFESNNHTGAHNPGGASGLFQLTAPTAKDIGYPVASDPDLSKFRAMTVAQQLAWATKFYGAHKGRVGTVARFYLSTFLPAQLELADDPAAVICAAAGPYADAYQANKAAFDVPTGSPPKAKGYSTPADLVAASNRASSSDRTKALLATLAQVEQAATPSA